MNRRTVLGNFVAGLTALQISKFVYGLEERNHLVERPGIQMYTLMTELQANFEPTLLAIRQIGYTKVESAGLLGKSAKAFRTALDHAGLICPSSHLFAAHDDADVSAKLDEFSVIGSKYVVTSFIPVGVVRTDADFGPGGPSITAEDYKRLGDAVMRLAEQAHAQGLQCAYHNHNMEFRDLGGGMMGFGLLMENTDPNLVKFELDCGWADLAGHSPHELLKQYGSRIRMLHVKDFKAVKAPIMTLGTDPAPLWTELGRGHLDYSPILREAARLNVESLFVEQEPPYTSFTALQAADADYRYLRSLS